MDTAQAGERESASATILVVEDDRAIRELLQLHLQNFGYRVVATPDAIVAGHWLLKDPKQFDLVVVDANLPYFTGLEFITTLIADTTLPALPAILITGHEELANRATILDVPCLVKPFSADDLNRLVTTALAAQRIACGAGLKENGMSTLMQQHERRSVARA